MEEYKENENITDTNAIVGMILGILSVILCWVPVIGLVLGIIALILSIKGLKNSKIINKGKGLSVTGISCGSVGIVVNIIYSIMNIYELGSHDSSILDSIKDEIKKYDNDINNYYNETKSYYRNYNNENNDVILDDYDI